VNKPKRSDFPKGKKGDEQLKKALVEYQKYLQELNADLEQTNFAPIKLPGITPEQGINDTQAKSWLKYSGATAKKGTEARKYYDRFIARLKQAGIPESKWQSVWNDAVDWTQTPGSGSTGDPSMYLNVWNPSQYLKGDGTGPKYGTQKQRTETTTKYGPSDAANTINQTFESEIGRTATKEEIDAYTMGANAAAKKEPSIYDGFTTTTGPTKGASLGTTTSKGTNTTGFDPAIYAANFARSRPDFAESFATKNFLKIIERLLKDPNAIGTVVE